MKDINQLILPDDLYFAKSHEWAKNDGEYIIIGISDYAQDQLGDVVFVELPDIGSTMAQGDELGSVESVKAVSELYLPVGGEITEINLNLADNPALVNESPYNEGWMIKIKPDDTSQLDNLMKKDAYLANLKGE